MELLGQLEALLKQKKSKAYYAQKLDISVEEVEQLMAELKGEKKEITTIGYYQTQSLSNDTAAPYQVITTSADVEKGEYRSEAVVDEEPRTVEELYTLHKIDPQRYKIKNYWSKVRPGGKFTSSVFATEIRGLDQQSFQDTFTDFLRSYEPAPVTPKLSDRGHNQISLIFPKQDAHYNKYDIDGNNDIEARFNDEFLSAMYMVQKARLTSNIGQIVYVVGSDQFNSEWTACTTKGTPQQNIHTYQEAFKLICDHEINMLNHFATQTNDVRVVFIPGNHDEYVGWHLIHFLESYYRNDDKFSFDTSTKNTKYHRYGTSAIMFNHGDDIKPKDLAYLFPIGFKEEWSNCDNYYIFTGDKHTELSMDIGAIKFYRIPQLSPATGKWDDKRGYTSSKSEMTSFVISEVNGMTDIYKEII